MRERPSVGLGARVGLAAASVVVALMFALRLAVGLQALPDVAADALTLILPGFVFGFLIDRLQEFGRPLMLVGLSSGLLVLGAALGAAAARVGAGWPSAARVAAAAIAPCALTVPVVFVALAPEMAAEPALTTAAYWFLFAVLLHWGLSTAAGRRVFVGRAPGPSRRALLYGAGALGAVWLSSYLGARLAHAVRLGGARPVSVATPPPPLPAAPPPGATPGPTPDPFPGLTGITSNADFYVITKNGVNDPNIDAARWRLSVGGVRPYALTYAELRALPFTEFTETLECISNVVGGGLMSTALFRGVQLGELLARAGLPDGTRELRFACADGYTESVPLDTAQDPRTIVVYLLGGEPLTRDHGFPARILMSARYGMKNPKWVTSIAPLAGEFNGYWEQRGWNRDAFVRTTSRFDYPRETIPVAAVAGRPLPIRGVAFAGARGIARAELSFDGGRTWVDADLRGGLPRDNWKLWTYVWLPAAPGRYELVVRATDGGGVLQDPVDRDSFPDGAIGYHRFTQLVS